MSLAEGSAPSGKTSYPSPLWGAGIPLCLGGNGGWGGLEHSRDKFIQVLILNSAVGSPNVAVALADDLLAAQARYLER